MIFIVLIVMICALALFPTFRCALFHPALMVWGGAKDVWLYFRHKKYNLCPSGELVAYTGLFGKGKTLSAVHRVVCAYRRYDGKPIHCGHRPGHLRQRQGERTGHPVQGDGAGA